VDLNTLVTEALNNTKGSLWPAFGPELILCVTIFLMLILRLFRITSWFSAFWVALIGSAAALFVAAPWEALGGDGIATRELFAGMLVLDAFAVYVRSLLLLFALLFAIFTYLSGIPDSQDSPDFYCLVLGATIGLCLMTTANHLLIIFLAVEMASVPSYVLAAMLKGRREASEAALKYSIYGAGAAGVMLYGISLLCGMLNTAHLPTMALQLTEQLPLMGGPERMVLALAGLMLGVGVAFKLSAVPFHFWCPDVFEGASAEVNAFLSVASKAGAMALLIRICIGLGVLGPLNTAGDGHAMASVAAAQTQDIGSGVYSVADEIAANSAKTPAKSDSGHGDSDPLSSVRTFIALLVAVVSVVTSTFGNLAAYGQTNIKRLLAYSTIAHAGYMMLPIPVVMLMAHSHPEIAQKAAAAIALYMAFYLFMNLGAFAVVAFLRNGIQSEEIADYAGLIHRSPGVVVCFVAILFSLVGIPPLAGFIGKLAVFASLLEGYAESGNLLFFVLVVAGGINTAISLVYYLRVAKVMVIDPEPERRANFDWSMVSAAGAYIALITLPLLLFFVSWNVLNEWTMSAAKSLFGIG